MSGGVHVEARFQPDGSARPVALIWRAERYPIGGIGRVWREGGHQHFLVETDAGVFELVYRVDEGCWRAARTPDDFRRHPNIA